MRTRYSSLTRIPVLFLLGTSFVVLLTGGSVVVANEEETIVVENVRWGKSSAEEARWLVNTGSWATMSFDEEAHGGLGSSAVSYADDSNGRIFLYLMGEQRSPAISLTLSEAALNPTSNFAKALCGPHGNTDPEDPRCAKLTVQGSLAPCPPDNACRTTGAKVLFERHPEMKQWPPSHHFTVHELSVKDVWMISNYGGGSTIHSKDYYSAKPKHHPTYPQAGEESVAGSHTSTTVTPPMVSSTVEDVPAWNKKVERSRWIVGHSLWTTVTTLSVHLKGSPWGNIRDVVDGKSYAESTGLPVFYLPTPDPTAVDVRKNNRISLLFSEAALAERLDPSSGSVCGGLDPMDPLCGQVMITGKAVQVEKDQVGTICEAFGERHPLASWLAHGGAHTGGAYYTIEPDRITILDFYGGASEVPIDDYLQFKAPSPSLTAARSGEAAVTTTTTTQRQMLRGSGAEN